MSSWQVVLLEPARTVLVQIGQFLINVLLVLIILIIGWLISKLIKTVVTRVLRASRVDALSEWIELDDILAKGGISYSLSELLGVVCYWLSILVTFVVAINAIGLTIAADLLNTVILYIPNIIAAVFILVLGMFVSTLLKNIVRTAAINAGITQVNLLSKIIEVIVIVLAVAIALEQLKIGAEIIKLTVTVVLGSLGLAIALAFGLGCKEIAGRSIADLIEKIKKK